MISSTWNSIYGWAMGSTSTTVLVVWEMIELTICMFLWFASLQNGPPQYRSSTIFEDASPEVVRDFFWDDEFRIKNSWDDMLLQHETLEECTKTGTMVVRWVRKVSSLHDISSATCWAETIASCLKRVVLLCSSHSSVVTGSTSSVAEYGHLERRFTVSPRYGRK